MQGLISNQISSFTAFYAQCVKRNEKILFYFANNDGKPNTLVVYQMRTTYNEEYQQENKNEKPKYKLSTNVLLNVSIIIYRLLVNKNIQYECEEGYLWFLKYTFITTPQPLIASYKRRDVAFSDSIHLPSSPLSVPYRRTRKKTLTAALGVIPRQEKAHALLRACVNHAFRYRLGTVPSSRHTLR